MTPPSVLVVCATALLLAVLGGTFALAWEHILSGTDVFGIISSIIAGTIGIFGVHSGVAAGGKAALAAKPPETL